MKKLLLALAALIPMCLNAQQGGMDKLMEKYENRQGVTIINLEGNIFEGIKHFMDRSDIYGEDTYIPELDGEYEWDDEYADLAEIADAPKDTCEGDCTCMDGSECACGDGECACGKNFEPQMEIGYYSKDSDDYDYSYYDEDDDEDDYDYSYYDDEDDYDYGHGYGSWDYLGPLQEYLNGLTWVKVMVYENYAKKFPKDIRKMVVSQKPYKNIVSSNKTGEYIRLYIIEDDGNGYCETLVIVGEDDEYIIINVLGKGDYYTPLFELLKDMM